MFNANLLEQLDDRIRTVLSQNRKETNGHTIPEAKVLPVECVIRTQVFFLFPSPIMALLET